MPRGTQAPALVILAAGASTRLGTCKALVSLRAREPATPLAMLLAAGGDPCPLVVTGADHDAIAAAPGLEGVELLHNPDWAAGRTGGIQRAARARPGRDLLLAPVDVPRVPRGVFEALVAAWREAGSPPRGWLAPEVVIAGERRFGHPLVVGRGLLLEAALWPAKRPLRELRQGAEPLLSVRLEALEVLDDLDRPRDLARLRALLA